MSAPTWDLYQAFLAVMETGSLSGASRALSVAQPTVRRQIEALEHALKAPLFTRAPNGLTPTETAHATLPHARAIAASAHALVRAASAPADGAGGTVRITASDIVGAEVLPAMLARHRDAHPEVAIELVLDDRTQDVLRREADVAIRMVAPTQKGLVQRKAAVIELGFYATAGYLAKHPPPRRVEELRSHALIGPDRSRPMLAAFAASGLALGPSDFALRTDSTLAQLGAVRSGFGIGICQVPLASTLVRVLPSMRFTLEAWVVTHEDLRHVARIRSVTDHLVRELGLYARPTARAPTAGPARSTPRSARGKKAASPRRSARHRRSRG